MQQTKTRAGLLVASCLTVLVLSAAPVWAEHGAADTTGSDGNSTTDTSTTTSTNEVEVENTTSESSHGGIRSEAAKLLQTKREEHKTTLSTDKKLKACEAHKAEFGKRASNYAAAAQRHLDTFDKIFTKLQDFYKNKGLNVSNYDTLVADATAKQTAAANAVKALKDADVTLDCSSTTVDPASTVATLKVAVQNARQALKDYRTSLKDLVVALKGASTAQTDKSMTTDTNTNDTTTGGTQ
jgi:hypothetical protein